MALYLWLGLIFFKHTLDFVFWDYGMNAQQRANSARDHKSGLSYSLLEGVWRGSGWLQLRHCMWWSRQSLSSLAPLALSLWWLKEPEPLQGRVQNSTVPHRRGRSRSWSRPDESPAKDSLNDFTEAGLSTKMCQSSQNCLYIQKLLNRLCKWKRLFCKIIFYSTYSPSLK
jgi:hypothetical protein